MQEERPEDHSRAGGLPDSGAARILEGTDGVTLLSVMGRDIAYSVTASSSIMSGLYQSPLGAYRIEWCRWFFDSLFWSHASALLLLQGGSLQQILQPWMVLRADPRPPHDPHPGADGVVLAELFETPAELTHQQLFELLLPEAGTPRASTT